MKIAESEDSRANEIRRQDTLIFFQKFSRFAIDKNAHFLIE